MVPTEAMIQNSHLSTLICLLFVLSNVHNKETIYYAIQSATTNVWRIIMMQSLCHLYIPGRVKRRIFEWLSADDVWAAEGTEHHTLGASCPWSEPWVFETATPPPAPAPPPLWHGGYDALLWPMRFRDFLASHRNHRGQVAKVDARRMILRSYIYIYRTPYSSSATPNRIFRGDARR